MEQAYIFQKLARRTISNNLRAKEQFIFKTKILIVLNAYNFDLVFNALKKSVNINTDS